MSDNTWAVTCRVDHSPIGSPAGASLATAESEAEALAVLAEKREIYPRCVLEAEAVWA
ncbi:hypothetical protein EV379_1214 [Microterricola gilva]|uniref:Uncharacterized protein n=1 Tax=Microterricola gilva TaxID=393267 RepID=A0A4Q8ALS2_9MICO|nr:hypothetical protein EV379_1214 [Microterricola gilva]